MSFHCTLRRHALLGTKLILNAYNESNKLKPALVIDAVRIDGVDCTDEFTLPDEPLPPDNQRFLADVRDLRVSLKSLPGAWVKGTPLTLEFDYHMIPSSLSKSRNVLPAEIDSKTRSMAVRLQKDLKLPIGQTESPVLPWAVCVHNGSLRTDVDDRNIAARGLNVACVDASLPTYARFSEGRSLSDVATKAALCDFFVCAPDVSMRTMSDEPVADYFRYFAGLREARVPFVSAVVKDTLLPLTAGDLRWLFIASIGEGSRGLLFPSEVLGDDAAEISPTNVAALESLFKCAHRLEVPVLANVDGLHCSVFAAGPNRLIVVAVNEWCSRQSRIDSEGFYAVPRDGAELRIPVPATWSAGLEAFDLGTGENVEASLNTDRTLTLGLRSFRTGLVTVLDRIPIERSQLSSKKIAPVSYLAEQGFGPVLVQPLSSPILQPVKLETSTSRIFEIPVRSQSDKTMAVRVEPFGPPTDWQVTSPSTTLAAGEATVVSVTVTAPSGNSHEMLKLALKPDNAQGVGFNVLIDAASEYAARAQPPTVDFGTFDIEKGGRWQDVEVAFFRKGSRIVRAEFGDVPVESVISKDGESFRFRPVPGTAVSFNSTAQVEFLSPEQDRAQSISVRFSGTSVDGVSPIPQRLTMATDGTSQARVIRFVETGDARSSIVNVESSDPRIVAKAQSPDGRNDKRVDVSVAPGCYSGQVTVTLKNPDAGSRIRTVTIPVRVLGTKSTQPKDSRGDTQAVMADVDRIVATFRQFDPPDDTPNWLLFHHLLMFGDDQSETDRFNAVYNRVARPQHPSAFVVHRGTPKARKDGPLFNREHHRDQFLNYLSMVGLPLDATFEVENEHFTIDEMLSRLKREARPTGELCWTASALTNLLPEGETWKSKFGETMSLAKFYEYMLENPNLTCGGSHELMSFATLLAHEGHRKDPDVAAIWPTIQARVSEAVEELRRNQRPDGSFKLPEYMALNDPRLNGRRDVPHLVGLHYTGHTVEWLSVLLSDTEMNQPWVVRAVGYLTVALDSEHPECQNLVPLDSDDRRMTYGFVAHAVSGIARWRSKVR